jgi:type I restriction-modification system DNA methylase subunit
MKSQDGRDADNIKFGSTLSNDQHAGERFDYLLANPPYGKDWKRDRTPSRPSRAGYAGRFGAGTAAHQRRPAALPAAHAGPHEPARAKAARGWPSS